MNQLAEKFGPNEHLYSPRMVEEIKEEKKLEHQTNKQ